MSFFLSRADAERFRNVAPPPDDTEPSPFSRPVAPPLSAPPPTDSGVEPDAAPNVSSWEPSRPESDPRDPYGIRTPYEGPPADAYAASSSPGETLRNVAGVFNPFSENSVFGSFYQGQNPVLQELARPSNYVGVGSVRGLARAALSNIGGRVAGEVAMNALPEDANPVVRGAVGVGAGLLGGVAGYRAIDDAPRVLRAADAAINPADVRAAAPEAFQYGRGNVGVDGTIRPINRPAIRADDMIPRQTVIGPSGVQAGAAGGSERSVAEAINSKQWFHGSGTANIQASDIDPTMTKVDSLFGEGLYLTDNPKIAQGYATARSKRTGTPTIYEARVTARDVIDLEEPIAPNVLAEIKATAKAIDDTFGGDVLNGVEKAAAKPGATGENVWRAMAEEISYISHEERIPDYEFQEFIGELNQRLRELGYDGYTHTGGKRTGNDPHQVLILFDPNNRFSQFDRPSQLASFSPRASSDSTSRFPFSGMAGGADEAIPPKPPAPPTAPVPAEDDAVRALRDALDAEINLRKSGVVEAEKAAGRARQAGRITEQADSLGRDATLAERVAAGAEGARVGRLRQTFVQGPELTTDQTTQLANMLEDGLANESPQGRWAALKALNDFLNGEGLQPAMLKKFQRVFGEDVGALLADVNGGRVSPRGVIDAAGEARIAQAGKFSEKQIAGLEERAQAQIARAAELEQQLNLDPTNSRLKRAVQQARQAGEYAQTKADELLARRTQSLQGVPDDPVEALAQQKTVYTAMDKLREAERVQRAGGQLAPDQEALLRTKEIVGRKLTIASEPAKNVINVVDEMIRGNRAILDSIQNDRPFLSGVQAAISGDLPDSFLTAALQRRALSRSVLERQGVQGVIAQKMANVLFDDELKLHYGGTVPDEIKTTLANAMRHGASNSDAPGTISTMVQRVKNTQFGFGDIGVFGQQVHNAIRRGSIPLVAGTVNRTLSALHLPHIATIAEDADIDRLTQYAIDGLHMGTGPSSARPEAGTVLSYLGRPGRAVDNRVLGPVSEALNDFQFGKVLGTVRNLDHEGNLVLFKLLGRDISDPKVRAVAADNANVLTSFARSAINANRRNVENVWLTSPSMTRARIKSLTDMAKLLSPKASAEERIVAASMIASTYGIYSMVGKYINDHIGVGDFEFDPSKPGYGVVTTRFLNKVGENIKIDIIPQDSIERAFAQSIRILSDPGTDDRAIQKAWERVAIGSGSVVPRALGGIGLGIGYEKNRGYRYGDMSTGAALKSVAPYPPILDNVGGTNTPLETGLTAIGVSNYPAESSGGSSRARPTRAPRPSRPTRPSR